MTQVYIDGFVPKSHLRIDLEGHPRVFRKGLDRGEQLVVDGRHRHEHCRPRLLCVYGVHLAECISQMVLESQLPHKAVKITFLISDSEQ